MTVFAGPSNKTTNKMANRKDFQTHDFSFVESD